MKQFDKVIGNSGRTKLNTVFKSGLLRLVPSPISQTPHFHCRWNLLIGKIISEKKYPLCEAVKVVQRSICEPFVCIIIEGNNRRRFNQIQVSFQTLPCFAVGEAFHLQFKLAFNSFNLSSYKISVIQVIKFLVFV